MYIYDISPKQLLLRELLLKPSHSHTLLMCVPLLITVCYVFSLLTTYIMSMPAHYAVANWSHGAFLIVRLN